MGSQYETFFVLDEAECLESFVRAFFQSLKGVVKVEDQPIQVDRHSCRNDDTYSDSVEFADPDLAINHIATWPTGGSVGVYLTSPFDEYDTEIVTLSFFTSEDGYCKVFSFTSSNKKPERWRFLCLISSIVKYKIANVHACFSAWELLRVMGIEVGETEIANSLVSQLHNLIAKDFQNDSFFSMVYRNY